MFKKIWNKVKKTDRQHEKNVKLGNFNNNEFKLHAKKRLATINTEFKHTFRFLEKYPKSVTFFGSSRFKEDHPDYIRARHLAGRISKETGYTVITGGGPGIMEAANRGAYEAGGKSIGMNIILPHEQKINEYLTSHIKFYYFFIRKVALSFSAEVYIFFPGGYGTLDEFFELITLVQTRKIPPTPIICIGRKYWENVQKLVMPMLNDFEVISPGDEKLFKIVDSDDEVIEAIKTSPIKRL